MIYSNPEFFFLLIPTVLLFYWVSSYRFRFGLLLVSSLLFYAWAGFFDTFIFLSVVLVSWLSTAGAHRWPHAKKSFLTAGIVVMAAHLGFWKYAPWVVRNIQAVLPHFLAGQPLHLPLPVGISFFTLQGIAYLIDYRRGEAGFLRWREYLLFKSFFPQLVAGPIVRVPQLLPQLRGLAKPRLDDVSAGIQLFAKGFVKKVLVADRMALYADGVYANLGGQGRLALVLGLLAYTVQIWATLAVTPIWVEAPP